jgi:lipopolysaccharide transport system ATP-binding protein
VTDDRRIIVEDVWKKYRKGQRHDSLRDLIPYSAQRLFRRRKAADELEEQEFWVVRELGFEVKAGEAVGIIGVNGAGKSTTLKLLTRILRPTRGRLEVRGRVGALIELAAGFHPDLTGRENIFLQGAVMGLRRAEVAKKFDEIVEFSGISAFIDTQVKRYSSGMNARLGFSIAAFLDPEVLLIDEVLAVGDMSFQQKCFERLRHFRREGIALAFVSHNMQAVASLCDRAILLKPGRPYSMGPVGSVVAEYLGGAGLSHASAVEIVQTTVATDSSDDPRTAILSPGERFHLKVTLRSKEDLSQIGFGIRVFRSDGLSVFDAMSLVEGVVPIDTLADEAVEFSVSLRLNVGPGTYSVTGHVHQAERLWPNIDLGVLATFSVQNERRFYSIAEMEPRFGATRHVRSEGPLGPGDESRAEKCS